MTDTALTEARLRRQERRKRRRRRQLILYGGAALMLLFVITLCLLLWPTESSPETAKNQTGTTSILPETIENKTLLALQNSQMPDWIDVQIIPVNGAGRRGIPLEDLNSIVVHYVGNPGTTAQQNRDYYAQETTTVSSHFLIGLQGEILQCVPLYEKSSATNERNRDTLSIEVCHPDESGIFTPESYQALVKLTTYLCELCDFDSRNIIRHYDVTGKVCPKLFVEDESAWTQFLSDIDTALSSN